MERRDAAKGGSHGCGSTHYCSVGCFGPTLPHVLDTNDQFTTAFTSAGLGYLKQLVSDHKK